MISSTKVQSPIYAKKEYHCLQWAQLTSPVVGDRIPLYQGAGNIPVVGNRLQLKANITYRLFAHILFQGSLADAKGVVRWYDHTNSTEVGSYNYLIAINATPNENSSVPGEALITPSTDIEVELRVTTADSVARFYNNSYGSVWAEALETIVPVNHVNSYMRYDSGAKATTNTAVFRFLAQLDSYGSDISYEDSAANGTGFRINTDGIYTISTCLDLNTSCYCALRVANAINNTPATTATSETRSRFTGGDTAYFNPSTSWTGKLSAGQIVWVCSHISGISVAGSGSDTQFSIVKVG